VSPSKFRIEPGRSQRLTITINAPYADEGQYFGSITLDDTKGSRDVRIPVAFVKQQGGVTLGVTCTPKTIAKNTGRSWCTTTATNLSLADVSVKMRTEVRDGLKITDVRRGQHVAPDVVTRHVTLAGKVPGRPSIAPISELGFVPLADFGVPPDPLGDEDGINYDVPAFQYAGDTYTRIGVTSDGYAVAGGATSADIDFVPQTLPNPNPPNNVLAPFWTDLDGTDTDGVRVAQLCDTSTNDCWLVVEWQVKLIGGETVGDTQTKVFQLWLGNNGTEDVTFSYDPANRPTAPPSDYGLTVGAENLDGSFGSQITTAAPESDYRVESAPGNAGGSADIKLQVRGVRVGDATVAASMTTPAVAGTTVARTKLKVK
jgi:hypothetical protein